jgi:transcriptional regulator with XRE-family HTH domain
VTMADVEGAAAGGPTVLRMLLGAQLRKLRENAGISREDAGYEIRASGSKISRLELGRVGFKERDVRDLLTLYAVTDPADRRLLLDLARKANVPGWWHRYSDLLPGWFQPFLGLESAAATIRAYEAQYVPGLLQTHDYARSVVMISHDTAAPDDVDRRVALRMHRQDLLTRGDAPQLWVVIDEAVLRRQIGGPPVMRGQIAALIEATKLPNVRLQILPFTAGGHAALGGAFSLLRFPDQDLPDVVYVEQLTGALYLDKRDDVEEYAAAMELLCIQADPPAHTVDILETILRELDVDAR